MLVLSRGALRCSMARAAAQLVIRSREEAAAESDAAALPII